MRRFLASLLVGTLILGLFNNPVKVHADTARIVTLGADLSEEQRQTVLSFFGVDEDSVQIIEVTNEDEKRYLSGIVSDDVIGTHTYSCAYIQPTDSGGINVKTANLTYITSGTLQNALITSGIQNCNLIVTAPFEVSGTGALTGVFKAYEETGMELDEDKKDLASEELVISAEMEQTYGEDVYELINSAKEEVSKAENELSDEDIKKIVLDLQVNFNISLDDESLDKLVELLKKVQSIGYTPEDFAQKLKENFDDISANIAEKSEGFFNKLADFFTGLFDKIKGLLGFDTRDERYIEEEESTSEEESTEESIFDDVNTSVFEYDEESTESEN